MLLLVLTTGVQLVNPQILRFFIDSALGQAEMSVLLYTTIVYILVSILYQGLKVASTYLCQLIGWSSTNKLREDLIDHCMHLDMTFHETKQPGEMIERLEADIHKLFDFFSKLVLDIINNGIIIVGILIFLAFIDLRLSLMLGVYTVIAIYILNKYQRYGVKFWVKSHEKTAEFNAYIEEKITGIEDNKASGSKTFTINGCIDILSDLFPVNIRAYLINYNLWNISVVISSVGLVIGLGFGAYLWSMGQATAGTVYLILSYTQLLNSPLEQIRRKLMDLQKAEASIIRLEELVNEKSKINSGDLKLEKLNDFKLELDEVCFEYTDGKTILNNISFDLSRNKTLGIVGRTGSGKTTIAKLIPRFYEIRSGSIRINGYKTSSFDLKNLRQHIAYITQDVSIFHATLRDNLTMFNSGISDDEIMRAAKEAGLSDWIDSKSSGLDTYFEKGKDSLSAGESQLIAFIRVFLRNPELIILDEASAKLDSVTEKYMDKAIERLTEDRACIIIAHKLSTLDKADDIIVLDKGNIVEQGEREKLMKSSDTVYYRLRNNVLKEVLV